MAMTTADFSLPSTLSTSLDDLFRWGVREGGSLGALTAIGMTTFQKALQDKGKYGNFGPTHPNYLVP